VPLAKCPEIDNETITTGVPKGSGENQADARVYLGGFRADFEQLARKRAGGRGRGRPLLVLSAYLRCKNKGG
jgi:hypothetical protein